VHTDAALLGRDLLPQPGDRGLGRLRSAIASFAWPVQPPGRVIFLVAGGQLRGHPDRECRSRRM